MKEQEIVSEQGRTVKLDHFKSELCFKQNNW